MGSDDRITGKCPADLGSGSDSDADSSGSDDSGLLRRIQERFTSAVDSLPATLPLYSSPTDDDGDEDLRILDAIRRKFPDASRVDDSPQHESGSSRSQSPKNINSLVDALKKNKSCQRLIRKKLLEMEAKIQKNKELRSRVESLLKFQRFCMRKMPGGGAYLKDPRITLITQSGSSKTPWTKRAHALSMAPAENIHVRRYKEVMERFPLWIPKKKWSDSEKSNLVCGIKQQYQEMVLLSSMNIGGNGEEDGLSDPNPFMHLSSTDLEVSPEMIRFFLPCVDWNRLSSMYVPGRSGAECEVRWLNLEDPSINHDPWTATEDRKLLFIVQERGLFNWIDISVTLGTHRTAFQCLARYQRSLNPHILNREWTNEEDVVLREAVEKFGDDNWQVVRSRLEGRTGAQCSSRWRMTLNPDRRKVGKWSVNEDRRLKAAVMLFGAKNWNKIAQFAPGRTQVQCRERWLNCLDPSINLEPWTAEEDEKLLKALEEHGYSWSKVARSVLGRTDNQCRRRWKVLRPEEVPLHRVATQMKKSVLISNFVGRAYERPLIGPNDFSPILSRPPSSTFMKNNKNKKSSARHKKPTANLDPENLTTSKCASVRGMKRKTSTTRHRNGTTNVNPENRAVGHPEMQCAADFDPVVLNTSEFVRRSKRKRKASIENAPYISGLDCCQSIVEGDLQGSSAVMDQEHKVALNHDSVEDHSYVTTADLAQAGSQGSAVEISSTNQVSLDTSIKRKRKYTKRKNTPKNLILKPHTENQAVGHPEMQCAADLDPVDLNTSEFVLRSKRIKKTSIENVPYISELDCCQSIAEGGLQGSSAVMDQAPKVALNHDSVEDHSFVPTVDLASVPTLDLDNSNYGIIKRGRKKSGSQGSVVEISSTNQVSLDTSIKRKRKYTKRKNTPKNLILKPHPENVATDHSEKPTADLAPVPTLDLDNSNYDSIKRKRKKAGSQGSAVEISSTNQVSLDTGIKRKRKYTKRRGNTPKNLILKPNPENVATDHSEKPSTDSMLVPAVDLNASLARPRRKRRISINNHPKTSKRVNLEGNVEAIGQNSHLGINTIVNQTCPDQYGLSAFSCTAPRKNMSRNPRIKSHLENLATDHTEKPLTDSTSVPEIQLQA